MPSGVGGIDFRRIAPHDSSNLAACRATARHERKNLKYILWGGVQFPTGSIVCDERDGNILFLIGCNSRTDGIVRMVKELQSGQFKIPRPANAICGALTLKKPPPSRKIFFRSGFFLRRITLKNKYF